MLGAVRGETGPLSNNTSKVSRSHSLEALLTFSSHAFHPLSEMDKRGWENWKPLRIRGWREKAWKPIDGFVWRLTLTCYHLGFFWFHLLRSKDFILFLNLWECRRKLMNHQRLCKPTSLLLCLVQPTIHTLISTRSSLPYRGQQSTAFQPSAKLLFKSPPFIDIATWVLSWKIKPHKIQNSYRMDLKVIFFSQPLFLRSRMNFKPQNQNCLYGYMLLQY